MVWPRSGRGLAEVRPRSGRGAAEVWPRCGRGVAVGLLGSRMPTTKGGGRRTLQQEHIVRSKCGTH